MDVRKTLQAGQQGTLKWQQRFGAKLLNVRYRYDDEGKKRYTTVEIIVEEKDYIHSPVNKCYTRENPGPTKAVKTGLDVYIRVGYQELDIRMQIKKAGAKWDAQRRLWQINRSTAQSLGLENRIVNCD